MSLPYRTRTFHKGSPMHAHILDYLDYYTTSQSNPMFAVMIDGAWGAGKTTLIREYLRDRKIDHAYVSLYGATTADEIAERLFVARHPILGSRGFTVAGRVLKGLLKASFRIDLDGQIVDGLNSTPVAPDPKELQDYAQGKQSSAGKLVVFDDLERCLAKPEMWGFINRLVEHEGAKVILLSAEDKIGDETGYLTTKEKNIGITLRVEPDVHGVIDALAQESNVYELPSFDRYRAQIIEIFNRTGCKSLRVLRFAMRDFARLLDVVPERHRNQDKAIQTLLAPLFTFAFGVYSGAIRPTDIPKLFDVAIRQSGNYHTTETEQEEDVRLGVFAARCKEIFSFLITIPGLDWWQGIFEHGVFDKEELRKALDSRFPLVDNRPNWLRLANFCDLTDAEFNSLLATTKTELTERAYRHPGEILHVAAVHIWAANQGLNLHDLPSTIAAAINAIDHLEPDSMRESYTQAEHGRLYRSHEGVGYAATEDVEFQKLTKRVADVIEQDNVAHLRQAASQLSKLVKAQGEAFLGALGFGDPSMSLGPLVLSSSLLQFVDQDRLVEDLFELDAHGQENVLSGISRRIGQRHDEHERTWVSHVIRIVKSRPPSLRRHFVLLQLRRCLA